MTSEMFRWPVLLAFSALALSTGSSLPLSLQTPRLGIVRMNGGAVRPVFGGAGSFVLGDVVLRGIQSASFSDAGGMVAYPDRIALLDATLTEIGAAPIRNPALVSISGDAMTAVAWVPKDSSLLYWTGTAFAVTVPQNLPDAPVIAVRRSGNQAMLLFKDQEATVSLETGNLLDCHGIVNELPQRVSDATGQKPSDLTIEQMSNGLIHILSRADARTWVMRAGAEGPAWELPAAGRGEQ